MDPSVRPPGGSIVVREAPPSAGGGLCYLARDETGRAVWTREAVAAERHPSLREANRAALTAPPLPGAMRPAYAVPASVADAEFEPQRPMLRLVVLDGTVVEPVAAQSSIGAQPAAAARPDWPPSPAAWAWMAWAPWIEAWRALVFGKQA